MCLAYWPHVQRLWVDFRIAAPHPPSSIRDGSTAVHARSPLAPGARGTLVAVLVGLLHMRPEQVKGTSSVVKHKHYCCSAEHMV